MWTASTFSGKQGRDVTLASYPRKYRCNNIVAPLVSLDPDNDRNEDDNLGRCQDSVNAYATSARNL